MTVVRDYKEILLDESKLPGEGWQMRAISSGDCVSYGVWNENTREALLIDPKQEDLQAYLQLKENLEGYLWLAVIDTHTHADHISAASQVAARLGAPLVTHVLSPSKRIHLRVSQLSVFPSRAGSIQFIPTPGHTPDAMCVLWGPFLFTGDTILYGDVGRDDLPGGDPAAHFESVQKLKDIVSPQTLVCPGHDQKNGRIVSWSTQLKINPSLTQPREQFIQECASFEATAPALFKKSLFENFK